MAVDKVRKAGMSVRAAVLTGALMSGIQNREQPRLYETALSHGYGSL